MIVSTCLFPIAHKIYISLFPLLPPDLQRYVRTSARSIEDVKNEQADLRKMMARKDVVSPGSVQMSNDRHPAFKSMAYPLKTMEEFEQHEKDLEEETFRQKQVSLD